MAEFVQNGDDLVRNGVIPLYLSAGRRLGGVRRISPPIQINSRSAFNSPPEDDDPDATETALRASHPDLVRLLPDGAASFHRIFMDAGVVAFMLHPHARR